MTQETETPISAELQLMTAVDRLVKERYAALADAAQWKANHDTQVQAARVLRERSDIPMERIEAHDAYLTALVGAKQLKEVREAVGIYHQALTARKHGGVAQDILVQSIERILAMHWRASAAPNSQY